MLSHSQCIGHDGESRIHRAARAEKAAIDDVEIVQFVRFAIGVQRAGSGIVAETNRSDLMRHTSQRNALTDVEVAAEQSLMAFAAVDLARGLLLHEFLQLDDEPLVTFFVVRFITENNTAGGIDGDPIFGITRDATGIKITWNSGTLVSSPTVNGTYTPVLNATSPYTVSPSGAAEFYQIRTP